MLIKTISHYLESNKRLVIPQLGAFIVKEPGESIVFSEMLKRDDGVLRGLLREKGSSEIEAAGEIDRLVFEVRHALQCDGEYRLADFGVLKSGPGGTITFVYEPAPKPTGLRKTPPAPSGARAEMNNLTMSPPAKLTPDPYVKGLRYGKPNKNVAPYAYAGGRSRRRVDRFVWIALIAVFMALSAIAFGLWCTSGGEEEPSAIKMEVSAPQSEQTVPDTAATQDPASETPAEPATETATE